MTITKLAPRPTVLVIDDTPNSIAVAHAILADTYEVKVANSGPRGLAMAQTDPVPDLILLDMMMPDMDGLEVCRRLQQSEVTRAVPVIFLTGRADGEDEEEGLQAGAVDYITKPLSPAILLARVAAQLELHAARNRIALLESQALDLAWDQEQCDQALRSFETSVAHDMRSTLSVVGGFAAVVRRKLGEHLDGQSVENLASISSGARHVSALVDHWRQMAALLRKPLQPEMLDMNAMAASAVDHALGEMSHLAKKPEIRLEALAASIADRHAVAQVWQQLISNALVAMGASQAPVLRISAAVGGTEIIYSVEDNGSGFPQDKHERLFAPFASLLDEGKRTGPGLGLFVAQQAIRRHHGRIWGESLAQGGARFCFSLPRTVAGEPGKEQPA